MGHDINYYLNLENRVVSTQAAIIAMQNVLAMLAVGTFDLYHPGHDEFFRNAKAHVGSNGLLVVGLVPDEDIRRRKG
jgi:cytidyltransferase-like protein